jgi:phosphate transport system substrate-binding protein
MNKLAIIFLVILTGLVGCMSSNESSREVDTPTSGEINIAVDETLQPIAEAQVDIFHHQYPNAKINIRYRSETQCVTDLYNDSCKLIFLGRQLNEEEMGYFKKIKFNPPTNKIATDAIALVLNPRAKDTAFTYAQVLEILRGGNSKYNVVFDNQNSGTVRYILNLTGAAKMPTNAFAASSNLEAVNYVAKNENAIGVIGWSWISDGDDPKTREYLSKTRLVALSPKDASDTKVYKPYQLNIAQKKYPLTREVYLIQRERRNGLSAGFTAFVLSDIGQTIMLKAGLLPAQQQDRWIELKSKSVGKVTN